MAVQDAVEQVGGRGLDGRARDISHPPLRRDIDPNRVVDDGHKELKGDGSVRHRRATHCEKLDRLAMIVHKYVIAEARKVMKISV